MKIIGITGSGFVLTAEKGEVQNLCGYSYEDRYKKPTLTVGTEILVHAMYNYLYDRNHAETALREAIGVLRRIADQAELVCPVFTSSVKEKKCQNTK